MKHLPPFMLLCLALGLSSCVPYHKQATMRTTTFRPGLMGAMSTQSVTEQPYESPAYTAAGTALFAR